MKERILELRREGKSYKQIQKILNCSLSTISYHCGIGQKEKSKKRQNKNRKKAESELAKKYGRFLSAKIKDYKRSNPQKRTYNKGLYKEIYDILSRNPTCYLTGTPIDLSDTNSYQLDHIIPTSRGGDCSINNLGLCITQANISKNGMLLNEFIQLCVDICRHNGYKVELETGIEPATSSLQERHSTN